MLQKSFTLQMGSSDPLNEGRHDIKSVVCYICYIICNKLCGRPPQYAPAPRKLTFCLESGVRVTCDMGYLCANFGLPRPLFSWLRSNVHDSQTDVRQTDVRQTDVRCTASLNASALWGGGSIITVMLSPFIDLTMLVGYQEGYLVCKISWTSNHKRFSRDLA